MVLDNFPGHTLSTIHDRGIVEDEHGLSFNTMSDEDMEGKWGGKIRAEVNTRYQSYEGETHQYDYSFTVTKDNGSFPILILQLKQAGNAPAIAIELKSDRYYIKHRYRQNGVEHGPTMAGRYLEYGVRQDLSLLVKWSRTDGFITVYRNGQKIDHWDGPTLVTDANNVNLKFGLYSLRFVDGIKCHSIIVHDCYAFEVE